MQFSLLALAEQSSFWPASFESSTHPLINPWSLEIGLRLPPLWPCRSQGIMNDILTMIAWNGGSSFPKDLKDISTKRRESMLGRWKTASVIFTPSISCFPTETKILERAIHTRCAHFLTSWSLFIHWNLGPPSLLWNCFCLGHLETS